MAYSGSIVNLLTHINPVKFPLFDVLHQAELLKSENP